MATAYGSGAQGNHPRYIKTAPTLKHLLLPATRPATFARGSMRYDEASVGFAWDATAMAEPNTHAFDTTEAKVTAALARQLQHSVPADRPQAPARPSNPVAPPPPSGGGGGGSGSAAAVVAYARAQVGKPYCYGGSGPGCFDCSGLTMMAWRQAGVSLPHSSSAQYNVGRRISASELQPGDLIFYYSPISHVSVYIGNGQRISATHTGDYVRVQSLGSSIVGFARPNG